MADDLLMPQREDFLRIASPEDPPAGILNLDAKVFPGVRRRNFPEGRRSFRAEQAHFLTALPKDFRASRVHSLRKDFLRLQDQEKGSCRPKDSILRKDHFSNSNREGFRRRPEANFLHRKVRLISRLMGHSTLRQRVASLPRRQEVFHHRRQRVFPSHRRHPEHFPRLRLRAAVVALFPPHPHPGVSRLLRRPDLHRSPVSLGQYSGHSGDKKSILRLSLPREAYPRYLTERGTHYGSS